MRFSVSDVFLPSADAVFIAAPGETEIEGTVTDFSDSGSKPRVFAVVQVVRSQTVVVPVEKLEFIGPMQSGNDS